MVFVARISLHDVVRLRKSAVGFRWSNDLFNEELFGEIYFSVFFFSSGSSRSFS